MGLNNKHTLQSGTIVLVTGAAGFIGFHVSQALLDRGCVVIGYDNCNDYYDVSLKEGRLGVLSAYPEFNFIKGDLADKEALDGVFTTYAPRIVLHLGAQAGVRYSIDNPYAYLQSNLAGFLNILEACRNFKTEHLVYGKRNLNYRDMWLGLAVLLDHLQEERMDIRLEEYDFYIRPNATDMRKGSTGLAYIVQNQMRLKPFDKAVFVFCGRSRRTIKAIVWDRNGWIEIIKRLECNQSFRWPRSTQEAAAISVEQLVGLLNGNDVWRSFPIIRPQLVG